MSKILLFTDPHFCTYSSILRKRGEKYSIRLENQLDTMNWLLDVYKKENCSMFICLGDFFDRSELSAEELSCLSLIDFKDVNAYFIVGNHELGRGDLSFSSAHTFLINRECEVFNKPSVLKLDNTLLYILPYQLDINHKKDIMEYFPNIPKDESKYRLLLTHNDIAGIQLGKYKTETGFAIDNLSENFDLTINGHLHNQQWVTKNILNLGNITGQNFSEDGFKYPHEAMIIDCDTLEYKLISNPRAIYFYKIDFTGKNNNIDYINKISFSLRNAVISVTVNEEDYSYIRYRFDPDYNPPDACQMLPKNCNIVQARVTVIKNNIAQITKKENIQSLQLDYKKSFEEYVLSTFGKTKDIIKELEEVLK